MGEGTPFESSFLRPMAAETSFVDSFLGIVNYYSPSSSDILASTDIWLDGERGHEVLQNYPNEVITLSDLNNYGDQIGTGTWQEIACVTDMSGAQGEVQNFIDDFDSFSEVFPTNNSWLDGISGGDPIFNDRNCGDYLMPDLMSTNCVGQNSGPLVASDINSLGFGSGPENHSCVHANSGAEAMHSVQNTGLSTYFERNYGGILMPDLMSATCVGQNSRPLVASTTLNDFSWAMGINGGGRGIQRNNSFCIHPNRICMNNNSDVSSYLSGFTDLHHTGDSSNSVSDLYSSRSEFFPTNQSWVDGSSVGEVVNLVQNTGSSTYSDRNFGGFMVPNLRATQFMKPKRKLWMDRVSTISDGSEMQGGIKIHNDSIKTDRKNDKRIRWTEEENKLLQKLFEQFGEKNWTRIAAEMPQRTPKQCRDRWTNHLKPYIKKVPWTDEEDKILIQSHHELGNKWTDIAKRLPGRTENTIKNRWHSASRRKFPYAKSGMTSLKCLKSSDLQNYIKSLPQNPSIEPPLTMDATREDTKCMINGEDLECPLNKKILDVEVDEDNINVHENNFFFREGKDPLMRIFRDENSVSAGTTSPQHMQNMINKENLTAHDKDVVATVHSCNTSNLQFDENFQLSGCFFNFNNSHINDNPPGCFFS